MHHLIVTVLEPYWEKRFIHASFACRKSRGTHGAIEDFCAQVERVGQGGQKRVWALQLDIESFFATLPVCRESNFYSKILILLKTFQAKISGYPQSYPASGVLSSQVRIFYLRFVYPMVYIEKVKKRDVEQALKECRWWKYDEGANHEKWTNGALKTTLPRHREIKEFTARGIIKLARANPGRK